MDSQVNALSVRDELVSGQQANATTIGSKGKVLRFYLDNKRDRYTFDATDHTFGSGIKSFWVCDTNNAKFVAKFVANYKNDRVKGSGIPLRLNMNQRYSTPINDACLEFDAQAGTWVDIAFSENEDIDVGNPAQELTGSISVSEGSGFSSTKVSITANTILEAIPTNDKRTTTSLQAKADCTFWIGTPTELGNVDFKNICHQVELGLGETFVWKNISALSIKAEFDLVFSRLDEVK